MSYQGSLHDSRTFVKCFPNHHIYEYFISGFTNQSVILWRIGTIEGDSLRMWKRYLGHFAVVIGIAVDSDCEGIDENKIFIRTGERLDTDFLQGIINEFGYPDIVLDDGSRGERDLCDTFNFAYKMLGKNGVYLIDDFRKPGAPMRKENQKSGDFMALCGNLIDSLNARHRGLPSEFADETYSMSFYDFTIVFRKIAWPKDSLKAIMVPQIKRNVFEKCAYIIRKIAGRIRRYLRA